MAGAGYHANHFLIPQRNGKNDVSGPLPGRDSAWRDPAIYVFYPDAAVRWLGWPGARSSSRFTNNRQQTVAKITNPNQHHFWTTTSCGTTLNGRSSKTDVLNTVQEHANPEDSSHENCAELVWIWSIEYKIDWWTSFTMGWSDHAWMIWDNRYGGNSNFSPPVCLIFLSFLILFLAYNSFHMRTIAGGPSIRVGQPGFIRGYRREWNRHTRNHRTAKRERADVAKQDPQQEAQEQA